MITAILFSQVLAWKVIPDNCDPVDIWNTKPPVREALIERGYLIWMRNCLIQKVLQEEPAQ